MTLVSYLLKGVKFAPQFLIIIIRPFQSAYWVSVPYFTALFSEPLTKRGDFIKAQAVKCDLASSYVKPPLPLKSTNIEASQQSLAEGLQLQLRGNHE